MPRKVIILNNCSMCPYKIWNGAERVCRLSGYKIINTPITEIPEWCELEDYCDSNFKEEAVSA